MTRVRFAWLPWLALWPWLVADAQTPREYLYVANSLSGDISIIEIPAHRVVGTIPHAVVGNQPDDVISNRDGSLLFVSRINDDDVIAISTATEQVAWRVDVGGSPNHLSLSADERYLYVPLYDKRIPTSAAALTARCWVPTASTFMSAAWGPIS
jgi:DNA-binding beta-propeller fold protein YncE